MTNLSEQFRERSRNLQEYVLACENFIGAIDAIKAAVDKMGSDPLGALDYLASVEKAPVPSPDAEKIARFKPERGNAFEEAVAEVVNDPQPDEPSIKEPPAPPLPKVKVAPKAQAVGRANRTSARGPFTNQIQAAQTWLYSQLLTGPMKRNDIEELAKKAGHTMYRVNEARRHSSDIVQVTVGLRGPSWWYIVGHEHLLPNAKNGQSKKIHKAISPDEQPVVDAIGADGSLFATIVGKTGLKPDNLRTILAKLQRRNIVTIDNRSGIWKPVVA